MRYTYICFFKKLVKIKKKNVEKYNRIFFHNNRKMNQIKRNLQDNWKKLTKSTSFTQIAFFYNRNDNGKIYK